MLAAVTPFLPSILAFVAFLLLLLVSLSVPIIKSIFLFTLFASISSSFLDSGVNGSVRFGVWGYCVSAIDVSVVGIGVDHSTNVVCTNVTLGYKLDDTVAAALHVDDIENAISRTITAVLVLHPIACALSFLTLLVLLMIRRNSAALSRPAYLSIVGVAFITALLTTIVFLIDVILVAITRNAVNSDNINVGWGNALDTDYGSRDTRPNDSQGHLSEYP
ncbi:hypothetical protein NLI96_g11118 [Meripilus lineatus]|uniref:Pali-domain-containing protein n=1 Tax=Meripilus lineatus TaxID=2056292 RepID=A0AAD5USC7_9APHY|nr:hypothetical protein NLI96_g11118 [Physisporinus lineatus]